MVYSPLWCFLCLELTLDKSQKFDGGNQLIWDASSLNQSICWRKYKYTVIDNLRPRSVYSTLKTDFGKAYHAAGEAYDTAIFEDRPRSEAVDEAVKVALTWAPKLAKPENWEEENPGKRWDNARTLETLVRAIVWYSEQYAEDRARTIMLPDGKPAIEVRFEVPLPLEGKRYSGRIDRIVDVEGALYILDRKTTGYDLGSRYARGFQTDNQVFSYIFAMRQMGVPVAGFLVDACQLLVGGNRFQRILVDPDESAIEDWLNGAYWKIEQGNRFAHEDFWPQDFQACSMYGGCQFRDICGSGTHMREQKLAERFEVYERSQEDDGLLALPEDEGA